MATYKLETYRVKLQVAEDSRANYYLRDSQSSAKLARAILGQEDADREHFLVLFLNQQNRICGHKIIASGGLNMTTVRPQEVYSAALSLQYRATSLIFVHNHPSGDPAPSPDDIALTELLFRANLFQFRILDHIILGNKRKYFSMTDAEIIKEGAINGIQPGAFV